jgi:translation initiation factor 2B subunit (eIF-2B alpha/beta/delta family)
MSYEHEAQKKSEDSGEERSSERESSDLIEPYSDFAKSTSTVKSEEKRSSQRESLDLIEAYSDFAKSTSTVKSEEKRSSQRESSDLIEAYSDFAKSTSTVVHKAASILEEEIAAGIVAAKSVEGHFLNVEKLRSENSEEVVMHRFRRDAHEVVDILVDVTSSIINHLNSISQNIVTVRTSGVPFKSDIPAVGRLPTIPVPDPIKAGESAEVPISLENNSDEVIDEFVLCNTELVSNTGRRIHANQIAFNPTTLSIAPHESKRVVLTVSIPEGCEAGVYSGMVMATNLNQLRSVITVEVTE